MANLKAKIKWGASEPIRPANVVLVQGIEDEVILSFGCVAPHIAMAVMNEEQAEEFAKEHSLAIEHGTRFILPARVATILMKSLKENLDAYNKTRGDDADSASEAPSA